MRRAVLFLAIALWVPAVGEAATDDRTPAPLDSLEAKTVTRIDVTGHRVTKEYVIRREIELRPGAPFRHEAMALIYGVSGIDAASS